MFNKNLELIREQIKRPSEIILPSFGVTNDNFSNTESGIYVIVAPKELWSFLVIFELKTLNRTTKHGVLLPGPSEPGLEIYTLSQRNDESVKYQAMQVPKRDCLNDHSQKFAITTIWDQLTLIKE